MIGLWQGFLHWEKRRCYYWLSIVKLIIIVVTIFYKVDYNKYVNIIQTTNSYSNSIIVHVTKLSVKLTIYLV